MKYQCCTCFCGYKLLRTPTNLQGLIFTILWKKLASLLQNDTFSVFYFLWCFIFLRKISILKKEKKIHHCKKYNYSKFVIKIQRTPYTVKHQFHYNTVNLILPSFSFTIIIMDGSVLQCVQSNLSVKATRGNQ